MKLIVFLMVFVLVNINSCGFHLRNAAPAFPKTLTVNVESKKTKVSPFVGQKLKQALEQQGSQSSLNIQLQSAEFSKRVLVLDENAQPVKQLMLLKIDYSFSSENGVEGRDSIRLNKNYFLNSVALASVSQYEESIKQQMLEEAAAQIRVQLYNKLFINR